MSVDQKAAKAIADKGEAIYAEVIKPSINIEQEMGKFIVIDVNTGDYEIANATRRPAAVYAHGALMQLPMR